MKGIVVEKKNEHAVLMLSDGTFKTVKATEDLEIGKLLFINEKKSKSGGKRIVLRVAAVFAVVLMGLGVSAWTTPIQYIGIDINPSIEMSVNRIDRIIAVTPLDDDGQALAKTLSLYSKRFDNGIVIIMNGARNKGYLKDEEDVFISISSMDEVRGEKSKAEIIKSVSPAVEVFAFSIRERNSAVNQGISTVRNHMIEKVIESGTSLEKKEMLDIPVKELMQRIRENRKLGKEIEKEEKNIGRTQ